MNEELKAVPFGLGEVNPYNKYFTGISYLKFLHTDGVSVANVTFEAGCRNFWHVHNATENGGQFLLATYGRGYYAEEGKEPIELLAGDSVYIPTGVKHWHGAAKDSVFSHVAIEVPGKDSSTEWKEEVSEEDYEKANLYHKQTKVVQTAGRDQLGGLAGVVTDVRKIAVGADVKSGLAITGSEVAKSKEQIRKWIENNL